MIFRSPLKSRVVASFMLLTFIIGGMFTLTVVEIFHHVEEQAISRELDGKLMALASLHSDHHQYILTDNNTQYYQENSSHPIPPQFKQLKPGYTEIVTPELALFAYRKKIRGEDYLIVADQTAAEAAEQTIYNYVLLGFALSVLGSGLVGWLFARRLISPIVQLSREVTQRAPRADTTSTAPSLAKSYADDEVGRLASAFDVTFQMLEEALQREKLFTSDVSHELRTSLMILGSSSEILLKEAAPGGKQHDHAIRIQRASNAMQKLVSSFLTLARLEHDSRAHSDQCTLLQAAGKQFEQWLPEFRTKGLTLELVNKSIGTSSLFHTTYLETVISNLLQNSLLYTESGGAILVLEHDSFSVSDTGVGIHAAEQGAIFQPFVRANNSGDGLGLGLSLTYRICQREGWHIEMQSLQPTGTRFSVLLAKG